jgi:hypothetical protein
MKFNAQQYSRRTALKMATATTAAVVGNSLLNRLHAAEAALGDNLK